MSILETIVEEKRKVVEFLKTSDYLTSIKSNEFKSYSFKDALNKTQLSLIAEVKKASPSKGVINPNFNHKDLALTYYNSGASALSVLTDERFFQGHNSYLMDIKNQIELPVLRKDFIIDPIQVEESAYMGADAILLIAAILSVQQAQELIDCAQEMQLDILLEIHDFNDFEKILALKSVDIIGINNRNLNSFEVDLNTALVLKKEIIKNFSNVCCVAESGYDCDLQLKKLSEEGFSGVLIGEGLVTNKAMIEYFKNEN